ncbi:MAG TPA: hypothetical protein VK705_09745 [Ferruginibacter sp.]|jgi:hypothetical protein|nr:hypothetical protein [Ferruginibacter sp.]
MKFSFVLFFIFGFTRVAYSQTDNVNGDKITGDKVMGNKIVINKITINQVSKEGSGYYKAMYRADSLELNNTLTEVFMYIANNYDFPMKKLLNDTLTLSDTIWVAELDDYGKRIQQKLESLRKNLILNDKPNNLKLWEDYILILYTYNQNSYKLIYQDKVSYPFIEKPLKERQIFFNNYNKESLTFFNYYKKYAKSFPLKKYLEDRLKTKF